eukprot:Seg549.6 transcript_id=Seg549.6/GoldUCD/mRNA.D3Y31 product="PiggyBac transposable element-derived protein 4" protein_id=Seg549.6/GoldUCD/D3Y31
MASSSKRARQYQDRPRQLTEIEVQRFLEEEILLSESDEGELFSDADFSDSDNEGGINTEEELELPVQNIPMSQPEVFYSIDDQAFDRQSRHARYQDDISARPKSIEDALDPEFFESMEEQEAQSYTVVIGNKKDKNSSNIIWTSQPPVPVGRVSSSNILKNHPGPTAIAKTATDMVSAWHLFISGTMISNMVLHTNQKIEKILTKLPEHVLDSDKYTALKYVDEIEMHAYLGLWMVRGVLHQNLDNTPALWFHESSNQIYQATMSRNRFVFLTNALSFDDAPTRQERWLHDRAAAIRDFFEQFNNNCARMRIQSEYLAIDETLYPYRGNIGFRQYNPSKPAKYGLLYRSISDSRVRYTYFTLPYTGKPREEPNQYYINSSDGYCLYLVDGLSKHVDISGRNISLDRFFTSISLANELLDRKKTMVGTVMANRKGIAKEIVAAQDREGPSTKVYFEKVKGKLMLTSYVPPSKKGKKENVIVLSTMHKSAEVSKDSRKKPNVIVFYDKTKGAVDIVDYRIGKYTVKNKKCPLVSKHICICD